MDTNRKLIVTGILAGSLATLLTAYGASAQSLSPMRGKVQSFTESFAVQVFPANPYSHRIRLEMHAYDQNFRRLRNVRFTANNFTLGAGDSRAVTAVVPFDGDKVKRVRICTEGIPFPGQASSNIKAQICGKFIGERR
ncbi:MAG: hypothetical protein AAFR13_05395 [Pseudomonadota bacterium]